MLRIFQLFFFIAVCLSVGWLGSLGTETSRLSWYAGLQKPPLNPPNWIFAPVWTTLYFLMALVGWRIWTANLLPKNRLRSLFVIQLLLNGIWSFLFFQLRNPLIAFADIITLWLCLFVLTKEVWSMNKLTGYLLVPYMMWLSFAVYLNAGILWLNR